MEKQVGFQGRVDVMSMTPGWPMAILPDHIFGEDEIPSSGELRWSQTPVSKSSSNRYARLESQRSIHRGSSKHNYGYSTAERPNEPGLLSFSNDGYDSVETGCGYYCAWAQNRQRRWSVACWTCIALLSVLLLAVFAMILTWCIIIPRRPSLDLDQAIQVNVLADRSSANFTLQFLAKNPNRVAVEYSQCRFYVSHNGTGVGKGTMTAFSQKAHNTTRQSLALLIPDVGILQRSATNSLEVSGRVHARLRVLGLPTPPVLIKLWCSVVITVSKRQVTTSQPCRIANHRFVW